MDSACVIGQSIYDLDTPCLLVDLDILSGNIERMQRMADSAALSLRPHIKTHKTPQIALMQQRAGARGLTAAKVSEAEVFAAAGFEDLFIAHEIVGPQKVRRLAALARYVPRLAVAVDSVACARGLSEVFAAEGLEIGVILELEGGAERCGVQPEELLPLAEQVAALPGLEIRGLFAYAGRAYTGVPLEECVRVECQLLSEQAERLRQAGHNVEIISGGCTPTAPYYTRDCGLTEIRSGTYALNDRNQIDLGVCTEGEVAATVLTTVVSVPTPERAICDAGSKALATQVGQVSEGFGWLWGEPEGVFYRLNDEHGYLNTGPLSSRPQVGDKLRVIPPRALTCLNLYNEMVMISEEQVVDVWRIAARGALQ
ncbi:MAG: alanine racemase [candidate division WS1 bacterium]|nr:alanine racemase [candidate division WS1 bacterium]